MPHTPTEQDVRESRDALTKLGYTEAVIRLARPDDPAAEGTLIAGVRIGEACVLSSSTRQFGGSTLWLAGLLPGGHCLKP
ncbi:hypothetical protein [Paractinoplanes rishiriensis]|nr:hypothetical protein [Actinoplanes rishiriensis]